MYLEPFLGSGAVFFHKRPSAYTLLNDRDGDVVNVFRVIRDSGQELAERIELTPWVLQEYIALEPEFNKPDGPRSDDQIENARRFLVRGFQAHEVRTDQMSGWRHVGADCAAYHQPHILVSIDPPSIRSTRNGS